MAQIIKFPGCDGKAGPVRKRAGVDRSGFLELRVKALLDGLDGKINKRDGERKLSMEDLCDFLTAVSEFLPREQMRFLEYIDLDEFDSGTAAKAFNTWLDHQYKIVDAENLSTEKVQLRRAGRSTFGDLLRTLMEVEISDLKGLISVYNERGNEIQKYALQMILKLGSIDFEYFLDSFEKYLNELETMSVNAGTLEILRKAVTSKVNLCLDREREKTSE